MSEKKKSSDAQKYEAMYESSTSSETIPTRVGDDDDDAVEEFDPDDTDVDIDSSDAFAFSETAQLSPSVSVRGFQSQQSILSIPKSSDNPCDDDSLNTDSLQVNPDSEATLSLDPSDFLSTSFNDPESNREREPKRGRGRAKKTGMGRKSGDGKTGKGRGGGRGRGRGAAKRKR